MSWRVRSPKTLAHRWPLNGHADDLIRSNHGTLVNTPTWAQTPWGPQCIELNGNNQYVNLGDVVVLNAVSAFTIAFWMSQDILDSADVIFEKYGDVTHNIRITTGITGTGIIVFDIKDGANTGGFFSHGDVRQNGQWYHIAMVYDGGQPTSAEKLIVYLDGVPQLLTFKAGGIPVVTADLSGVDAWMGRSTTSLNGKLFDVQIHNVTLTRDEVNDLMRGHG